MAEKALTAVTQGGLHPGDLDPLVKVDNKPVSGEPVIANRGFSYVVPGSHRVSDWYESTRDPKARNCCVYGGLRPYTRQSRE
jgi:hypothetical protein